jgi:hypothetical protein
MPQLSYAAVDTPCTTVNGEITNNPPSGTEDCATQPTIQRVIFLKAALCKASSIAFPTTSTPIDTSSCTTIWEDPAGESIDIQLGSDISLSGSDGITIPDPDTYPIVYLEMKPYFGISASKKFAQAMGDTSGNNNSQGGQFCRSLPISVYSFSNTTPASTLCTIAEGSPGITTYYFNALSDDGTSGIGTYTDDNLQAALITSARTLISPPSASAIGNEEKLVAWFTQNTVVNSNTSGFSIGFGNSRGASIELTNLRVESFTAGPFDITLTPK